MTASFSTYSDEIYNFITIHKAFWDFDLVTFYLHDEDEFVEEVWDLLSGLDVSRTNDFVLVDLQRLMFCMTANDRVYAPFTALLSEELFDYFTDLIGEIVDECMPNHNAEFFNALLRAINKNLWRDLIAALQTSDMIKLYQRYHALCLANL